MLQFRFAEPLHRRVHAQMLGLGVRRDEVVDRRQPRRNFKGEYVKPTYPNGSYIKSPPNKILCSTSTPTSSSAPARKVDDWRGIDCCTKAQAEDARRATFNIIFVVFFKLAIFKGVTQGGSF